MFICLMICLSSPCTRSSTSSSNFCKEFRQLQCSIFNFRSYSPPKVVIPIQSFKDVNGIDHDQLKLPLKIDSSGQAIPSDTGTLEITEVFHFSFYNLGSCGPFVLIFLSVFWSNAILNANSVFWNWVWFVIVFQTMTIWAYVISCHTGGTYILLQKQWRSFYRTYVRCNV